MYNRSYTRRLRNHKSLPQKKSEIILRGYVHMSIRTKQQKKTRRHNAEKNRGHKNKCIYRRKRGLFVSLLDSLFSFANRKGREGCRNWDRNKKKGNDFKKSRQLYKPGGCKLRLGFASPQC